MAPLLQQTPFSLAHKLHNANANLPTHLVRTITTKESTSCAIEGCNSPRNSQGPDGKSTLCKNCGKSWWAAKKPKGEQVVEWKTKRAANLAGLSEKAGRAEKSASCAIEGCDESMATTRSGPDGEFTLCSKCGQAWKHAGKPTGEKAEGWKKERSTTVRGRPQQQPTSCAIEGCDEAMTGPTRSGPDGKSTLCPKCGMAWSNANKPTGEKGEEWKKKRSITLRRKLGKVVSDEEPIPCAIKGCDESCHRTGPDGKGTLCSKCGVSWAKTGYPTGEKGEEWKRRRSEVVAGSSGLARHTSRAHDADKQVPCDHCGRCDLERGEHNLCIHCRDRQQLGAERRRHIHDISSGPFLSHAAIHDIAYREWRRLHPNMDLTADLQPSSGANMWHMPYDEVEKDCRARGFSLSLKRSRTANTLINWMQIDDAYNGFLPRPMLAATHLHSLGLEALQRLAREAGYPSKKPQTTDALIQFLLSKRDVTDELFKVKEEKLEAIRKAVEAALKQLGKNAEDVTHQSHNGGIVGSELAFARLHTVLANGHYPTRTSGEGLLCGPRALAAAIDAARRHRFGSHEATRSRVYDNRVTMEMLMSLLFQNPDASGEIDAIGIPTEEYAAYLHHTFGHLPEDEYGYEYTNMTQLNNMDFQQLIAMIVLARRAGLIEEEFSLGVVRGTTVDMLGNPVPALAQIMHEGDNNAATLFLHYNAGLSGDDYSHWEGFSDPTHESEIDIAHAWGLNSLFTQDAPVLQPRGRKKVCLSCH